MNREKREGREIALCVRACKPLWKWSSFSHAVNFQSGLSVMQRKHVRLQIQCRLDPDQVSSQRADNLSQRNLTRILHFCGRTKAQARCHRSIVILCTHACAANHMPQPPAGHAYTLLKLTTVSSLNPRLFSSVYHQTYLRCYTRLSTKWWFQFWNWSSGEANSIKVFKFPSQFLNWQETGEVIPAGHLPRLHQVEADRWHPEYETESEWTDACPTRSASTREQPPWSSSSARWCWRGAGSAPPEVYQSPAWRRVQTMFGGKGTTRDGGIWQLKQEKKR